VRAAATHKLYLQRVIPCGGSFRNEAENVLSVEFGAQLFDTFLKALLSREGQRLAAGSPFSTCVVSTFRSRASSVTAARTFSLSSGGMMSGLNWDGGAPFQVLLGLE